MKLIDILNLLECNKTIVILTPNKIEAKLLYDRFRLNTFVDVTAIDKNTLNVRGHTLMIITPDIQQHASCSSGTLESCNDSCPSHILIEFPESIPKYILNRLSAPNVIFCPEIV